MPYFFAVWAFGTYVGDVSPPWTIGWAIMWLLFSPAAVFVGIHLFAASYPLSIVAVVGLVVATPFYPTLLAIFTTLLIGMMFGGSILVWRWLMIFVALVCGTSIWYTGGIGL